MAANNPINQSGIFMGNDKNIMSTNEYAALHKPSTKAKNSRDPNFRAWRDGLPDGFSRIFPKGKTDSMLAIYNSFGDPKKAMAALENPEALVATATKYAETGTIENPYYNPNRPDYNTSIKNPVAAENSTGFFTSKEGTPFPLNEGGMQDAQYRDGAINASNAELNKIIADSEAGLNHPLALDQDTPIYQARIDEANTELQRRGGGVFSPSANAATGGSQYAYNPVESEALTSASGGMGLDLPVQGNQNAGGGSVTQATTTAPAIGTPAATFGVMAQPTNSYADYTSRYKINPSQAQFNTGVVPGTGPGEGGVALPDWANNVGVEDSQDAALKQGWWGKTKDWVAKGDKQGVSRWEKVFGGTDDKGNRIYGGVGRTLGLATGLANTWIGMENLQLAKDQHQTSKDQWQANYDQQMIDVKDARAQRAALGKA